MIDLDFFVSPIGLGHLTRDIAIVDLMNKKSLNFITGSGAARFLSNLQYSVIDAYNPPDFDVQNGELDKTAKWLWKYFQYYKDCKKKASKILTDDNPKIVVSDEDFASLTIGQSKKKPTILITDILETRFTKGFASIIERKMNHSMKEIIKKCDCVIIPEFGQDEENIRRVGPIVRKTSYSREELRKKFNFTKKIITISIGGTDAGKFLIEKTLQCSFRKNPEIEIVVVSGPSLQKEYQGVKNFGFVNNLHEIIYASDVLISLAGKSSIDEAKAYGTPAIFIPIKGHFEQEDNAKELGFNFDDISNLEKLVGEKLVEKRNPTEFDGAKKASKIITEIINSSS